MARGARKDENPFRRNFAEACGRTLREAVGHRHSMVDAWRDMVEVLFLSIRNGNEPRDDAWQAREARYHELHSIYGSDVFRAFQVVMAELMLEATRRPGDLLGEAYQGLGQNRGELGQHFTPYHVSALMAQMAIGPVDRHVADHGVVTMMEPSCGSGGMVVATAQVVRDQGHDPLQVLRVTAQDIDPVCWRMTYVACAIYGIPARVVLGDTLAGEEREVALSPAWIMARRMGLPF